MTQKLLIVSGYKAEVENRSVQKEKLRTQAGKDSTHSAFGWRRQALWRGILFKSSIKHGSYLPTCEFSGRPTHLLLNEDIHIISLFKTLLFLQSQPLRNHSLQWTKHRHRWPCCGLRRALLTSSKFSVNSSALAMMPNSRYWLPRLSFWVTFG